MDYILAQAAFSKKQLGNLRFLSNVLLQSDVFLTVAHSTGKKKKKSNDLLQPVSPPEIQSKKIPGTRKDGKLLASRTRPRDHIGSGSLWILWKNSGREQRVGRGKKRVGCQLLGYVSRAVRPSVSYNDAKRIINSDS